jgi:hypothetical protein
MSNPTTEVEALTVIDDALTKLEDPEARDRVLRWAVAKFGGSGAQAAPATVANTRGTQPMALEPSGISGPAALWLRRNGIETDQALAMIFSLDQQELDVIASEVPGANLKGRMRSVLLLRGVCSFLRNGEFKFSDDVLRDTCKHYNAYDKNNFAKYLSGMNDEIVGNRESGYALTPKGQKAAADLVKSMTASMVW